MPLPIYCSDPVCHRRNTQYILTVTVTTQLRTENSKTLQNTTIGLFTVQYLVRMLIIQNDEDDGSGPVGTIRSVDQGKRSMLQRATAVALGVQVGHFFELQGSLDGVYKSKASPRAAGDRQMKGHAGTERAD